jgi:regulator of sigma E protease
MSILGHVSSILGYVVPFIFVLSIVVFFHELGHFLVGRWCGVKVDAFSIGFGPEIAGFVDRHGTRWRIAALPLGGYVKFHGDANGASVPDNEAIAAMPESERRISFFGQPVRNRAAIVAAGPIANFLLAIVIFTGIFYSQGRGVLIPRVNTVATGEAAAQAGIQPGDLIVSIDGKAISSWADMQRIVQASADTPLNIVVQRGNKDVTVVATPRKREIETPFGKNKVGLLGVTASNDPADWKVENMGLVESVTASVNETWYVIERTGAYIGGLFVGKETTEQISGPIRIAEISGQVAKIGIWALLNLAAILSISIGLINLVPVPLLDGGHLLYYAFEAVRGKPLSERAQEFGFKVGMALVGALMIFATFNDILNLTKG